MWDQVVNFIVRYLDSAQKVMLVVGAIIVLMGIWAPKPLPGGSLVEWTKSQRIMTALFGLVLVALSLLPTVDMGELRLNVTKGRDLAAGGASNTGDLPTARLRAEQAVPWLDKALKQLGVPGK